MVVSLLIAVIRHPQATLRCVSGIGCASAFACETDIGHEHV